VRINWNGKRRYIAGLLLLAGILVTINLPPVIPVIQLPGEKWPGREILGLPITNTLFGSVVAWILIVLLIIYVVRRRPQSGSEVPAGGFYNIFEMLFEGLYGFIGNIAAGPYLNTIFKMFFTIFIIVILSNWQSIIPGVDSIGFLEPHVHVDETGHEEFLDGYDVYPFAGAWALNAKCPWVSPEAAALLTEEEQAARIVNGCTSGVGAPVVEAAHEEEATVPESETTEATTDGAVTEGASTGEEAAEAVEGGSEAVEAAEEGGEAEHHVTPGDPSVPWVVLPYVRPPSTDLNMTVALALIAVVMIQVIGFRALGISYLTKFFNFKTLFSSPLGGIDVAVGLLELIGEFAKILSFAFRLLGNVFAGSVLLFVMSFLLPFLPWPFFILEFFVGALQAFVFGLLTAIFMTQATASHGGHDEEEHAAAH
jgi:F-type H+-transporting ATPase subunit a